MILLRERLRLCEPERLAQIARHWGVEAEGPGACPDADAVVDRMLAETPVRTAFDRLSQPEKDVLRAMYSAAHKGWVAVADIRRLGTPGSVVDDLTASLAEKAVAFTEERELPADNPYWGPTWAGRRLATRPTPVLALPDETAALFLEVLGEYTGGIGYADVPSPLNRLEALSLDVLQAMAEHYGVAPEGAPPSALKMAGRLQPVVRQHAAVWQVIQALPPELRAVIDAVEAAGGRLPMEEVRTRFAPEYGDLHALLRALTERGLGFDRFIHRTRTLLVPDRTLEALAEHTLPELPSVRLRIVEPPASEEVWRHDLQWGLLQLVRHVRVEGLSRTATTHAVPKRTAARLVGQMRRPPLGYSDEEWVEQCIRYLAAVGVLQDTVHLRLAAPSPAWLQKDAFTQAHDLFRRWLEGHIDDHRQGRQDLGLWMDRGMLAAGRSLLVDLLRSCPVGKWVSVESLLHAAAGLRPFFLRERDRLVRQQGYRGLKRMLTRWFDVEGRALTLHLAGLPFELGLIAFNRPLAPDAPVPPDAALRLTKRGAALLGQAPPPEAPDEERMLVVQPNFEVVAMEFVPSVLDALGHFAIPVGCDGVATYRIDRRCANLALANGWSGTRMLDFLNAHLRTPLPQNVAESLRDWASSIRKARFTRALVIEAEDAGVLEDLASSKLLKGRVRGIVHRAVLLLEPDVDLQQVARELRPEGFVLEAGEE